MASSDGSICPLSCHPATVPSGLITHAVICKPRLVTRSVPRMTVTRAVLAASATSAHARSRNAGSGDGAVVPGHRYPGKKHSGKQITIAPRRFASATADVARRTDSSGVAGTRMFARAMRTMLMVVLLYRALKTARRLTRAQHPHVFHVNGTTNCAPGRVDNAFRSGP